MRIRKLLLVVGLVAMVVVTVFAGKQVLQTMGVLDPPASPGATSSYTLEDIYNRLNSGATGGQSTFTEPTAGPGTGTMHTLDEIMGMAPAKDDANGATTADVLAGKTFWGLNVNAGKWGPRIGAAVAGSNVSGSDGNKTFAIPDGFYSGKAATANDTDLVTDNIAQGVDIFGVVGSAVAATGNASVEDVLIGMTFSNAGGTGIIGTMPDKEGDNASTDQDPLLGVNYFRAPRGYYDGDDRVSATDAQVAALDSDITEGNIKSGVDIFGVTGSYAGTSCAGNATTEDVLYPKTFSNSSSTGLTGERYGGCTCSGTLDGTRWCDNGDGTVTDLTTCLVWLKDASWGGTKAWRVNTVDGYDDAHMRAGLLSAADVTAALTDGSVVGDWRLPTETELYGLRQGTEGVLSGSPRIFTGVQADFYWSSTADADDPHHAWLVHLRWGNVYDHHKEFHYYVWPVRGGQ